MGIATNVMTRNMWDSGMVAISGDLADNYNDMTVAGLRKLKKHDYLSVVVSRNGGAQSTFTVQSNSAGFSACILDTAVAFSSTKGGSQPVTKTGWTEVTGSSSYSTEGYKGLFGHQAFNSRTGRFTAPSDGVYLVSAILRLDGANKGWFSAGVLTNGQKSWESGMTVLNGDMADNYDDMTVCGLRQLKKGDVLSVWVYSQSDSSYTLCQLASIILLVSLVCVVVLSVHHGRRLFATRYL